MEKRVFFDLSDLKFVCWNIVFAALAGIAILVGLIYWLRGYTQHGVEVEVEDVRGLVVAEAEPILNAKGLRLVVVDSTYSDKVPFGTIVEQDPRPESHAKEGRAIYVTINATGKRQVVMPDLHDLSYRQAETTLRGLGIIVDSVYEYEPSAFRDLVLDIKSDTASIQPGDKIPVGTKVRLVVGFGRGTEQVEVPTVIGLTLRDARSLLLKHRLTVGAVLEDEEPEADPNQEEEKVKYIYRQAPDAGERIVEGETVSLWLSSDLEKVATGGGENTEDDGNWF